jgi:hypothetical protein
MYMLKMDFNLYNYIGFIKTVKNSRFPAALLLFRMEHGVQFEG